MLKKGIAAAIAILLLVSLAVINIHSVEDAKRVDSEMRELSAKIIELEDANMRLQVENSELRELAAQVEQKEENTTEIIGSPIDAMLDAMFDANPIDSYFSEMSKLMSYDYTTVAMMTFANISCSAWQAEMDNCYETLKSKIKDENYLIAVDNDRDSYVEYLKNNAEIDVLLNASGAFYGEEDVWVGTLGHILRPSSIERGYREKTKELFNILIEIGETPEFVFSPEKYEELLRQEFEHVWQEAFG